MLVLVETLEVLVSDRGKNHTIAGTLVVRKFASELKDVITGVIPFCFLVNLFNFYHR